MDLTGILVQVVAGAVGGNAAGAVLKNFNLGLVATRLLALLAVVSAGRLFLRLLVAT